MTITSDNVNGRDDVPTPEPVKPVLVDLSDLDNGLTLLQYQLGAHNTAIYPGVGTGDLTALSYLTLKLNGEAGEVAEKLGKIIRDKDGQGSEDDRQELKKELGDVLWYVAMLSDELNLSLEDVANTNLDKLQSRKDRGVIGGSGDNR